MKTWTDDNPKAGLLARKRDAILAAARRQFLAHGYGGTSMEAVAADAGVSIMTLYRHAESKDDLFAATVAVACHTEGEPAPDLAAIPLRELLTATALAFQQKLSSPETTALLRAVIAEQGRFPELATIAYDATLGHLAGFVADALHQSPQSRHLDARTRTAFASGFVDDLFGADLLRTLLGLAAPTSAIQKRRAEAATGRILASLSARVAARA